VRLIAVVTNSSKICCAIALASAAGLAARNGLPVAVPASASTIADAPSTDLSYPAGIKISVALAAPIDSQGAHVGDSFAFKTTRDVKLGDLDVPANSPGQGRLAIVVAAQGNQNGQISLQADRIDPPGGPTIWVNIDTSANLTGHYAKKNTKLLVIPLPIGIVPIVTNKTSGDLILDAGTVFGVVTVPPRDAPAPLLTAPPSPAPAPSPSAP
jgi:hypothetical protein